MATVSFRVPDEIREKIEAHDQINRSAVIRQHLEEELADLAYRIVALVVATSERLSQQIDKTAVAEENTADVMREFRDNRYGSESS